MVRGTGTEVPVTRKREARGGASGTLPRHVQEPVSLRRVAQTEELSRGDRRRLALVAILGDRAEPILERVVGDALRATDFLGLGGGVAARYLTTARACLPACLEALGAPDAERTRILEENAQMVKDIVAIGVPKFVQRSLVGLGFRIANGIARDSAREHGFEPDELEDELRVFQRAFEARLFFGA